MLSECHIDECRILISVGCRELNEVFVRSTVSMAMLSAARNALRQMDCLKACSRAITYFASCRHR
jgi:hypothetical protein